MSGESANASVIVTGAAGGIGIAVARRLAADGYAVVAVDVEQERLENLVAHLPGQGHVAAAADLTDVREHSKLVARAVAGGMRLHGLANLAAVLRRRASIDDITEADWDAQMDVNLKAAFFFNRAVAQALISQGSGGSIVNFTSQAWWTGGFGGAVVYAASKGGLVSMSRNLARSLAHERIRVNTVAPGFVETDMMLDGLSDEQVRAFNQMVPLQRMADASELAGTVSFLLGADSSYITGATINVTGGQLMY